MTEETMMGPVTYQDEEEQDMSNQILVTGITWNKETFGKYKGKKDFSDRLPSQITLTLPDGLNDKKDDVDFYDRVETFVYNLLKNRFNHEAYHCQIWLPLEEGADA